MRKLFIALTVAFTLMGTATVNAQKHRHDPNIVKSVADTSGIVAYSDTTGYYADTDSIDVEEAAGGYDNDYDISMDNPFTLINSLTGIGAGGIIVAVFFILLCIIVVLSPIILIVAIVYMLLKRSDRKYKMVEKAVENGQPIPQEVLVKSAGDNNRMWAKGVKNIFTGLGLVVFFYVLGAGPITGVGWLVFFCGVGQAVIARTTSGQSNDRYGEDCENNG